MTNQINFPQAQIEADLVLYGMMRDKLPMTRENYIIRNWGEVPAEWNAEHEAELPQQFQDWTKFEKDERA